MTDAASMEEQRQRAPAMQRAATFGDKGDIYEEDERRFFLEEKARNQNVTIYEGKEEEEEESARMRIPPNQVRKYPSYSLNANSYLCGHCIAYNYLFRLVPSPSSY